MAIKSFRWDVTVHLFGDVLLLVPMYDWILFWGGWAFVQDPRGGHFFDF